MDFALATTSVTLTCLKVLIADYLEGQGDFNRLIMGIIRVTIWVVGVITLLTKSPDPPSM